MNPSAVPPQVKAFHVLTKPTGPICNLDCKYCFYLEKENLYADTSQWAMREDVLESYVRQYIESQTAPVISFAWQGGEPTLLGVDFFRKVVRLQAKYAAGKKIENGFQTNGVLLDDRWGEFLAENGFLVGISIDGPERLHDRYRVDKGGAPSFRRVMRGLGYLRKHGVEYNTLTVVQRSNSRHPLEVYRFLKQAGSRFMQFIPIVERESPQPDDAGLVLISPDSAEPARVSPWSVDSFQYGKFLCAIFDEWVRRDVGRYYVQIFDVALESWMGMAASLCVFRETCGSALALEHNGDLYSCDHYVYPENLLGNIMEDPMGSLVNSPKPGPLRPETNGTASPATAGSARSGSPATANAPSTASSGLLRGRRGSTTSAPDTSSSSTTSTPTCVSWRANCARDGRRPTSCPGSGGRDLQAQGRRRPGRNDPCLCGSGKKYKKCCGRR